MHLAPTSRRASRFVPCLLAACGLSTPPAHAETLYETDFETFTTGSGKLANVNGWTQSVSPSGATITSCSGIDSNLVPGLGKTAYLGYYPPSGGTATGAGFVRVNRKVTPDPVAAGKPIIEFYCVAGLKQSTNGRNDDFQLLVYNQTDNVLGGLVFDLSDRYIYRYDGNSYTNTGSSFDYDETSEVAFRINYLTGLWSADVAGVRVVDGAVLTTRTTTEAPRTFGSIGARWLITTWGLPGNNWMLLDDWQVNASPEGAPAIASLNRSGASTTVNWWAEAGYTYHLEAGNTPYPASFTTLAGSSTSTTSSSLLLSFTDTTASATKRFYRLVRTLSSP